MKHPKIIKFNQTNEVRAIARERIGPPKYGRIILPKPERDPKYPNNFKIFISDERAE